MRSEASNNGMRTKTLRTRVVFDAGGRPAGDSALAVLLELAESAPSFDLWWAGPGSSRLSLAGARCTTFRSLRHRWLLSTADAAVTTHGLARSFRRPSLRVQLTHGVPVKAMGHLNAKARQSRTRGAPMTRSSWELIVTPSRHVRHALVAACDWTGSELVAPLPRYDLTRDRYFLREASEFLPAARPRILFAPTYRSSWDNGAFDAWAVAHALREIAPRHYNFVGKRHYIDTPMRVKGWIAPPDHFDTTVLLSQCDVLITDYSSLVFDAACLDVPTVILAPDVDQYSASPGLCFDLASTFGTLFTTSPEDALRAVARMLTDPADWRAVRPTLMEMASPASGCFGGAKIVADAIVATLSRRHAMLRNGNKGTEQ